MLWDVSNGVSRRNWAGGKNAIYYSKFLMENYSDLKITLPNTISNENLDKIFE